MNNQNDAFMKFSYFIYIQIIITKLLFIYQVDSGTALIGKIIDEENKPVAYSHIGVEGTKIGTISDEAGEFSLDISDMSNSDILVISSIGYESERFNYNHLIREGKLNIVLKKKIYTNDDIDIIATKTKKKIFGSIKTGRNSGWKFSGIANGNQIGMIFKNADKIILSKLSFHVETKGYDSLLYRLNFYTIDNENFLPANKEDILKSSPSTDSVISVKLDKYKIDLSENFGVTIEILKGWKNKTGVEQTEIIFTGRNSIRDKMILKSHQFAPIDYHKTLLNISVESFTF
jgi:hypothetical protein